MPIICKLVIFQKVKKMDLIEMRNFLIDYGMTNREAINLTTSEYYKRLELVSKFGIAITGSEDIELED